MHKSLPSADQLPWTISYVIRKRLQIDSYSELPKEKRPPDDLIWYGSSSDIDEWFDKVTKNKHKADEDFVFVINEDEMG